MRAATASAEAPAPEAVRHRPHEDVQALFTGALFAAFGILLFQQAGLLPGGTVGVALLLHYLSGLDVGVCLMLANAPFYLLAWFRLGREFTAKTVASVGLAAALTWVLPQGLAIQHVSPLLAAVLGGLMTGTGILVLFRHRASLGGFNVLVLCLQERFGWRPGLVQMGLDAAIVLGGAWLAADGWRFACSVLAVVTLNLVLMVNHRPGRYHPGC